MNIEEKMALRRRVLEEKKIESLMARYRKYCKAGNHFKAQNLAWYMASAFGLDNDRTEYDYE